MKTQKIDGKQLLTLKEKEIEGQLGLIEEASKTQLKELINQLKLTNLISLSDIITIPEELKCPLTKNLMEDPVVGIRW